MAEKSDRKLIRSSPAQKPTHTARSLPRLSGKFSRERELQKAGLKCSRRSLFLLLMVRTINRPDDERTRRQSHQNNNKAMKNKIVAALLALFLGGIGVHKFYLGQSGAGIIYLLFCWTGIPTIIALFEVLVLLLMSDQNFDAKFNRKLKYSSAQVFNMSGYAESSRDKVSTLGEMKKLYEADIITAEEYEEKRRKILDSI